MKILLQKITDFLQGSQFRRRALWQQAEFAFSTSHGLKSPRSASGRFHSLRTP